MSVFSVKEIVIDPIFWKEARKWCGKRASFFLDCHHLFENDFKHNIVEKIDFKVKILECIS